MICLAAFTPLLAEVALKFGAFEFFWLALFGVTMSGTIVGQDPLKGWLMGLLGLFVAQIGQEGLYAYNRFTFGWDELAGGIALIPALVGAFGLAEVLTTLSDPVERKMIELRIFNITPEYIRQMNEIGVHDLKKMLELKQTGAAEILLKKRS